MPFIAQRTLRNDPGRWHCLDRRGDALATPLTGDGKVTKAGWRSSGHRAEYRRTKGEMSSQPSEGFPATELTIRQAKAPEHLQGLSRNL
jgi:hypothetical protein